MKVTKEDVLLKLYPEEPNYKNAAKLGTEALDHLREIINGADPLLAAKAVSLVSWINDEKSIEILIEAARSRHRSVRILVASASKKFDTKIGKKILDPILKDKDESVRLMGLKSKKYLEKDK
jgi:HEAT repeat protein